MKVLWTIIAVGLALGAVFGAAMVLAAPVHNPQGEFIDLTTGKINYIDLSVIFLSGLFIVSTISISVLGTFFVVVKLAIRGIKAIGHFR